MSNDLSRYSDVILGAVEEREGEAPEEGPTEENSDGEKIMEVTEAQEAEESIDTLFEDLDSDETNTDVIFADNESPSVRAYADTDYDPQKFAGSTTLTIPKGTELPQIDKIDFPRPRIALGDVIIPDDRIRKEFDPVALHSLATSMLSKGQLQPILINKDNILIAGERRLRAAKILFGSGHERWNTIWYSRRAVKDAIDTRLIELEENFRREDIAWQEQVLCVENIHEILKSTRIDWTVQQTANKLGISSTTIFRDLKLAKALRVELADANKHQLSSIRTAADAMKSLQRSRERELITELGIRLQGAQAADKERLRRILDEMATRAVEKSDDPLDRPHDLIGLDSAASASPVSFQQDTDGQEFIDVSDDGGASGDEKEGIYPSYEYEGYEGDESDAAGSYVGDVDPLFSSWDGYNPGEEPHDFLRDGPQDVHLRTPKRSELLADQLPYKIHLGDCMDILPTIPTASINCIVSDPIWGIDVDTAYFHGAKTDVHFSDAATDLVPIIPEIIKQLDRILTEDAHIYIFGGYQILPFWTSAMQNYWEVAASPLIWDKTSGYATHPERKYMASYEMCIFAAKGVPTLRTPMRDVFQFKRPAVADRMVQTQKPVMLLRTFIENSTLYGQTVLDFMCGSGSTIQAAIASGRKGIGIEIDENTHSIALKSAAEALDLYVKPQEQAEGAESNAQEGEAGTSAAAAGLED